MYYLKLKFLILLFIPISLSLSAATYYVSPSGSDATGSGTAGSPWKTLAYACSKVTTSGSVIHVNAGTYIESQQCNLAEGVSIEGEGDTSRIISHYQGAGSYDERASIVLASGSEGTNGNQSISYIKLDGDGLTGYYAIKVVRRINVIIHHCTVVDFYIGGIRFEGKAMWQEPSKYATGNQIHHCSITNCSDKDVTDYGAGNISFGGQLGLEIYNNTFDATTRTQGHNGNILSAGHYNKGVKYYNNKSYKPDYDGENWNFHMEAWYTYGGMEIFNNEFYGGDTALDCAGHHNEKGGYDYTFYIHDNYFTGNPVNTYSGKIGVNIEGEYTCDVWIKNNHFNNIAHPVQIDEGTSNVCEASRIYITNNLMVNCGMMGPKDWMAIIQILHNFSGSGSILSDIYIYNNVIIPNSNTSSTAINIRNNGLASNINIKNNIIVGHTNNTWLSVVNNGSINGLHVTHNGLYNNSSDVPIFSGNAPVDYQLTNSISGNPLFVSSTDYHLQSSSPYIDAGTDVGILYSGKAPDIGAFEYQSGLLTYNSSVIENATPKILEITYSLSLANIVPTASAFTVMVNSSARTVNTVTISGTKVFLTLASAIISSDVITVAYTKPASNPLQTVSGVQAATITPQTVTNRVIPIPVYVSSVVNNTTPSLLEMTYNLSLANIVPAPSAFTVMVNSAARTVNSVAISGTKVQLTLASAIINGDVITVAYTKPGSNPLQTPSGGQAVTITAQSVTNNVGAIPLPVYLSSVVENATPSLLEMTYNLSLANIVPAPSAFTVMVNSAARTVNSVAISGTKVQLTLASAIINGDVIKVTYVKPGSNPLQTPSGGQAVTITAQIVTNNVGAIPKADNPVCVTSVIENLTPNKLEMTFNEALGLTIPAESAFTVKVNGLKRGVILVSISGTRVILTIASPVVYGDIVTVIYEKPLTNQLQSASGATVDSFNSPQPVTNKLEDNSIKKLHVLIYPNPAREYINISQLEGSLESEIIRIFDFSGKLCLETLVNPNTSDIHVTFNLRSGNYLVQIATKSLILFTQKLIVMNY
jgi:uncharacterized repeat protein (TIGR02059 family)